MKFDNFSIAAMPFFHDAYCRDCKGQLRQVDNGFISIVLFCPKCESVYVPKLVRLPPSKVSKEWIKQAKEELKVV